MESSKTTKRALVTSVLALLMCVTMLVGATFAWFTDTASTEVSKIQAGNLDLEVQYRTAANGDWKTLDNATDLFGAEGTLFEPGHTRVVELKIKNAGNLALKYKIGMNVISETAGTNKDGNPYKLSNYLKVATSPIQQYDPNAAPGTVSYAMEQLIFEKGNVLAWEHRDFANFELEYTSGGSVHELKPGDAGILGIKVYMPETVGNEANAISTEKAASINFGLNVVATQYTVESDSYGTQYDKDATYPAVNQAELTALLNGGKIVTLGKDIAPIETITVSGNVKSTLDLNGKEMANTTDIWEHKGEYNWSLVSARSGANLTITGNGTFAAKANDCYAVDVQDGSTVTITSGTFNGNIHAVYVLEGTAIIQGGFYSVQQKYPDSAKADEFVLNCYDANRANGTAKIIVTGGTFVNFNPADCQAEGAGTNFVADGYKVVTETQTNGDVWYTVVPK
ncbi:TasA family protein [Vescimonas sp.]|uniref:TasA family protein n=1 Tax=Vescimonas sp. TaxID=2892404 RepID=UPI003078C1F9